MLNQVYNSYNNLLKRICDNNPWTNVYGLARSILALSLLITLLFSGMDILFPRIDDVLIRQPIFEFEKFSIFYLFRDNIQVGYFISIIILISVISGYFPQITAIFHWWVTSSYMISGVIIEGGDQIASILTLLLIPICLTDNRINHWYLPKKTKSNSYLKLISYSSFFVISLQIAVIYFHAFTAKLFVPEWLNGTATYYWFTHQIFGVPEYLRVTIAHLLSIPFVGICITWGGIFIELILFAWLFMSRNSWNWKIILFIGILFHLLIALIHGLVSFSLVMIAALILYLVPKNKNFKIRRKTATNIA